MEMQGTLIGTLDGITKCISNALSVGKYKVCLG